MKTRKTTRRTVTMTNRGRRTSSRKRRTDIERGSTTPSSTSENSDEGTDNEDSKKGDFYICMRHYMHAVISLCTTPIVTTGVQEILTESFFAPPVWS